MTQDKKPRVMIADDETHSRTLVRAVLKDMNCEVVCEARNGAEAVECYRQFKPHLLLLDINMPVKAGDDVLKEILAEFPNAFVIMLTSVATMEQIEKCIDIGAANYIRKDTPIMEIKKIIKETWAVFLQERGKLSAAGEQ